MIGKRDLYAFRHFSFHGKLMLYDRHGLFLVQIVDPGNVLHIGRVDVSVSYALVLYLSAFMLCCDVPIVRLTYM
jgi:hypothetical protein